MTTSYADDYPLKQRAVMMPTLSSLEAPQVVMMTTCGASSDNKAGIMATLTTCSMGDIWVSTGCHLENMCYTGIIIFFARGCNRPWNHLYMNFIPFVTQYSLLQETNLSSIVIVPWATRHCFHSFHNHVSNQMKSFISDIMIFCNSLLLHVLLMKSYLMFSWHVFKYCSNYFFVFSYYSLMTQFLENFSWLVTFGTLHGYQNMSLLIWVKCITESQLRLFTLKLYTAKRNF